MALGETHQPFPPEKDRFVHHLRTYPDIAPYHCGPSLLAAILQDPGTLHGAKSGAYTTREVGVHNPDPTAKLVKRALEFNGIPLSAYLPLNAIPWYDAPKHRSSALLREGAAYNRALILSNAIKFVLLFGKDAHRSAEFLNLPADIAIRKLPHPGRLGLINFQENGQRIGAAAAGQRIIDGFKLW